MISLDPSDRPTFDTLLHTSRGTVFPESFYSFLHNYVSSINELSSDVLSLNSPLPTSLPSHIGPSISGNTLRSSPSGNHNPNTAPAASAGIGSEVKSDTLPSDSDHRLDRIWADYESIEPYITPENVERSEMDVKVEYIPSVISTCRPFQVSLIYICKGISFSNPEMMLY
jgi:phosphoinositide-3-kinase, regulatory subunit 4